MSLTNEWHGGLSAEAVPKCEKCGSDTNVRWWTIAKSFFCILCRRLVGVVKKELDDQLFLPFEE